MCTGLTVGRRMIRRLRTSSARRRISWC
ncbi:unnamed protein product [Linum tenue]|uniref:Uncharacterized protein n=1 Tax=Linum tenue TaxID=586396 RepID=A0AAV0MLG4_9ROSI|nr:unnamed protein product [Linum tenue]